MNATYELAHEIAEANPDIQVTPDQWAMLILFVVQLLMECFDDTELAAKWLNEHRFVEALVVRRVAAYGRQEKIAHRWRAARALVRRGEFVTRGMLACLYLDRIDYDKTGETAEYAPLAV